MSVRLRALTWVMWRFFKPTLATYERGKTRLAAAKPKVSIPWIFQRNLSIEHRTFAGFSVYDLSSKVSSPHQPTMIYWHGGGFVSEIDWWHWRFVSALARSGVRVLVPVYPLAPDYSFEETLTQGIALYDQLQRSGKSERITFMGDSAGGAIALSLAMYVVDKGRPAPTRVIALAPCPDITLSHPELPDYEQRDPWLSKAGVIEGMMAWAGLADPRDYRVSPAFGDLSTLPPVEVYVGTSDLLYPDCRDFVQAVSSAGGEAELIAQPDAMHVFPLLPIPEGRAARKRITARLHRP